MNKDDMSDDAQFDAFLKGEDELSRLLQALPQPAPSAELDAAIMRRVKLAVAQQGQPAANDPGQTSGTPTLAPGLGRRWRIPAGIAATVLVGVFAHQAFDASNRQMALPQEETSAMIVMPAPSEPSAEMPPPAEMRVSPPAKVTAQAVAVPPPPPPAEMAARPAAPRMAESASPVVVDAPSAAPAPAYEPAPAVKPAPVPQAEYAAGVSQFKRATADKAADLAEETVMVTGSRIRSAAPEELLGRIEAMLKAEQNKEALAAWTKFREAYPDHAVPRELEAKIKALQ